MKVVKCDCSGCNKVSVKMNKITINLEDGTTEVYDICNKCLSKINSVINGKTPEIQTETHEIQTETHEIQTETHEVTKKNKKGDVIALINEYGMDRLKEEYIENNKSAKEIADELGISKTTLAQALSRLGITKRKHNKEHKDTNNEKEDN